MANGMEEGETGLVVRVDDLAPPVLAKLLAQTGNIPANFGPDLAGKAFCLVVVPAD